MSMSFILADEEATRALGIALASVLDAPILVGLSGDLGAGKTTLVRALINAELPGTRVKSPTYTLVESYALARGLLHHLDLYRLRDADELNALGIDELLSSDARVLVEWPEKGAPLLPQPDLLVSLSHLPHGRRAEIEACSAVGRAAMSRLERTQATAFD